MNSEAQEELYRLPSEAEAAAGYGEVTGLGDGLWVWYGADFDQANQLLRQHPAPSRDPNLAAWALAYKSAPAARPGGSPGSSEKSS